MKREMLIALLGKGKGGGSSDDGMSPDTSSDDDADADDGRMTAARDLIRAVKDGDASAVAAALDDYRTACEMADGDGDDDTGY